MLYSFNAIVLVVSQLQPSYRLVAGSQPIFSRFLDHLWVGSYTHLASPVLFGFHPGRPYYFCPFADFVIQKSGGSLG